MGLGGIKSAWQRQTKDFGHEQAHKYSCLVIDNRGIGESDRPLMRYSTSEMALDIIEILDHVKWTGERSLHVLGVSMGGMIAQELAFRIPERTASLTLISTGGRIRNTVVGFTNLDVPISLLTFNQGFFENVYNRAMLL
jgi:pimeloyl-ACP methyl ester carboxylesterase